MKIALQNLQRKHPLNRAKLDSLALGLMERLRSVRPDLEGGVIYLFLTGDRGSERINRLALGHDRPTDVVTRRFEPVPGEPRDAWTGEIFVNVERAWSVGGRLRSGSPSREMALYIAHGFDHLSGWDDRTPQSARRMRRREWRWLKKLDTTDLIGPP